MAELGCSSTQPCGARSELPKRLIYPKWPILRMINLPNIFSNIFVLLEHRLNHFTADLSDQQSLMSVQLPVSNPKTEPFQNVQSHLYKGVGFPLNFLYYFLPQSLPLIVNTRYNELLSVCGKLAIW